MSRKRKLPLTRRPAIIEEMRQVVRAKTLDDAVKAVEWWLGGGAKEAERAELRRQVKRVRAIARRAKT